MPTGLLFIYQFLKKRVTDKNIEAKSQIISFNPDFKYKNFYRKISGEIYLKKLSDKNVRIYGSIKGLPPGTHAFHIHEFSDMSKGCESLGGHYNPFNKNHGARTIVDKFGNTVINQERHVGDLGNIVVDQEGVATIDMVDSLIKLDGPYSVLNRSFVIHEGVDDLGKGGTKESLTTGSAGKRIACGKIIRV